ncbi:MAG: DUF1499 domain-containing protein [Pyrinomonadaceae bacterium]|nr:DUF1499 domain-containing protein [Pyrinomonadaceae bacterium]
MKKLVLALLAFVLLGVGSLLFIGRTYYPDNVAVTAPDGGSKQLVTRVYKGTPDDVKKTAKEVIGQLTTWGGSWKITDETDGGSELRIKAEVPVVVFTDDLEVIIKERSPGQVSVDVKSQSRVGKSDFGENARHVRKFLAAMDKKLTNS